MSKKTYRCAACGVRTPVIFEHEVRVRKVGEHGRLEVVEEWSVVGPMLCPICHNEAEEAFTRKVRDIKSNSRLADDGKRDD